MSESPVDKLESQLEAFIEGAFTRIFRRPIQARDIAVLLLREMDSQALPSDHPSARYVAPDTYQIQLPPVNVGQILEHDPETETILARLIIDLCAELGYQLHQRPTVSLRENVELASRQVRVNASHSPAASARTAKMAPVRPGSNQHESWNPLLILEDNRVFPLAKPVINIGRGDENDIIVADAFASRRHLQLRRLSGTYVLFDVNSRGGTRVNDQTVREHRLCNGDLIQVGRTAIVYTDQPRRAEADGTTRVLQPE